jgi:hypothetical protein
MARTRRRIDDDRIVEDGESVRIRLDMMDALQRSIHQADQQSRRQTIPVVDTTFHVPGYVQVADSPAIRDARKAAMDARREMIDRATNAWRSPSNPPLPRPTSFQDANAMRREARDAYIQRTCDAWRTPVSDAAQPDLSTTTFHRVSPQAFSQALARGGDPSRMMQPQRPPGSDDNPQARRDRAYKEYCDRLGSAWKSPANPAAAANAVESQRRGWTHEDGR